LAALVLFAIVAYTILAVIIATTSGRSHGAVFWPTVTLMAVFAVCAARIALALWTRSSRQRS